MSTNQSPEFTKAQQKFLDSKTDKEKLESLEEMMRTMPQHKSAESLRANIRQRYKKLKGKLEAKRKQKKLSAKQGIKKQGIQVVFCGLTNSGKSSILKILTNASPEIADYDYTTKYSILGTLEYEHIPFQLIDMPAINHENFDQGLANSADILLIVITDLEQIPEIFQFLNKAEGKKIIIFNKSDLLTAEQKRRIAATLKSKRYDFLLISTKTQEGIGELKEKLFENSNTIRVSTKEPRKQKSPNPVLLKPKTTVEELAKKIFHSSVKIKEIRITGPSSKFPNQKVSLQHILKDKDVVEFYTC